MNGVLVSCSSDLFELELGEVIRAVAGSDGENSKIFSSRLFGFPDVGLSEF